MKNAINKLILGLSVVILFVLSGTNKVQAQNEQVSFQLFYDELSPYGEWINDPEYGYVWLPDVGGDFQPYATNGRWVNTEYGNTWFSDYEWGWAPFHYGRWHFNDRYGWGWVPGYEWGPAWVSWRQGGGQYGWAPLAPNVSFAIHVNIPLRHWVFVPQRYFFSPRIYAYYTPYSRYNRFYNRTVIINNTYIYNNRTYYGGPSRRELACATRGTVRVYNVSNSNRRGRATIDSRNVSIYRPSINQNTRSNSRPSRVADVNTVVSNRPSRAEQNATSRPASAASQRNGSTVTRPSVARGTSTNAVRSENARPTTAERSSSTRTQRSNSTVAAPSTSQRSTSNTSARPARSERNNSSTVSRPATQ